MEDWKDWKDHKAEGKPVIGKTIVLGLTDGSKIYTYGLKIKTGVELPKLEMMQDIDICPVSVFSDMGQHRLTGSLA